MRVVLLCATARGRAVLEHLAARVQGHDLVVVSFREQPVEPPFLEDIRRLGERVGARFFEARDVARIEELRSGVDLLLAVSWRYLVPPEVFTRARLGAFVMHDSLLPAYRGFSPTVWALINGEQEVGATLFAMADEVDSGDIVDQRRVPVGPDDTIAAVMDRVTGAYLDLVEANLDALLAGTAARRPQDHGKATYTCKRQSADNQIRWEESTSRIHNLIRAVTRPYEGAFTFLEGRRLRIWAAEPAGGPPYVGRVPGRVVQVLPGRGSVVLTGDGALFLTRVQLEGQAEACAADVLGSLNITLGSARSPE